jgi:hypothetical protein
MGMQTDVWAVNPSAGIDDYFYESATIDAAGTLSISANDVGTNGWGYRVKFTTNGDETATTLVISGLAVGKLDGQPTTEKLVGSNNSFTLSDTYWSTVYSIVAETASVGAVKIGFGGDLALPRTRIRALYYISASGSITFTSQKSDKVLFHLDTGSGGVNNIAFLPPEGILTTKSTVNDFCVVTMDGVTKLTIVCG